MKYLTLVFLLFSLQIYGQITGNIHVKDNNAVKLDSATLNHMLGKWKLVESVEMIHDEEQRRIKGIILDFNKDGEVLTSWCLGCYEEIVGEWAVLNETTLRFFNTEKENNKLLVGEWVIYKLTDEDMVLAKVLTSSGSWKKFHILNRDIGDSATTEISRSCINCTTDGYLCWGDRPEEAMGYWIDIDKGRGNSERDEQQDIRKIEEGINWLLKNAPCIRYLYVKASEYYNNLLETETDGDKKELYTQKLKEIEEQRLQYFRE